MRWPWQREPVRDEAAEARIEEQELRHRQVLRRARRVLLAADERIIDDYEQAEERRVAGRAKP